MQGDFHVEGYAIEGLLGVGSSGELWLARERSSNDQVALRRFRPRDADAQHEARRIVSLLDGLSHPGLLRVREMVQVDESQFVLVSGYAAGGTLEELLTARGTLHPGELVTITSVIADALATVHQLGLVHGDVTPESIVFTPSGRPLLTDVGLSTLVDRSEVMGTLGFTDPATLGDDGGELTAASDVYGLAAVCYTALSGTALDPQQQRRPLHQLAPGVPPALAHAIEAGLNADPAARPSAGAFGGQLDSAVSPAPVQLPEGAGGPRPFLLPDQGGPLQAGPGPDPYATGQPGQPGPPSQGAPAVHGGSSLFATETPLAPQASFTPPRPLTEIVGDDDDDEDEDEGRRKRKVRAPRLREDERERPFRNGLTGRLRLVLIGVPVLVLLAIVGYVGLQALSGSDEPEGPQAVLSGPNAEKWADVLAVLDQRISIAYAAGDPAKLAAAYKPGSFALKQEQQNLQAALAHWDRFENYRTPASAVHVVSEAKDEVVLNVVSQRQEFIAVREGDAPYAERAADPHRYRITLAPDGKGGWVYWGIQQIPMNATPTPAAGE